MRVSHCRRLAIFLIGGSCAAGYAIGKATWNPAIQEPEHAENPRARPVHDSTRDKRTNEDPWEQLSALLSPDSHESDIWKIVSRLPAEKIPEAIRNLRAAQFLAPTFSDEAEKLAELESALYFHWAESDPQAALADVSTLPGAPDDDAKERRRALLKSVLAAWMRVDANAAYEAVKDHRDFGHVGRDMLVATWAPENVFQNADRYPDKHRDLLGWYCIAAAGDETKRSAMLTAFKEQPEMKDKDWAYFMLFREWAYNDFPAAMAEAEQHEHPGLVDHVLEDGLNQQPAEALRWAVAHNIPPGGPRWEESYRNWMMFDPATAKQWLIEQAPSWKNDGHFATVASFQAIQLGRSEKIDMAVAKPIWESLMSEWENKDPEAAAKWLNTRPAEAVRGILAEKGSEKHD